MGFQWWQIDIGGWFILILEKLGLAWDIKAPTKEMLKAKKADQAKTLVLRAEKEN